MVKCVYCGEEDATTKILNPNLGMNDKYDSWDVCEDCKNTIKIQLELSLHTFMLREFSGREEEIYKNAVEYAKNKIKACEERIKDIVKKSGKSIMIATITQKKDGNCASISKEYKTDGTIEIEVM